MPKRRSAAVTRLFHHLRRCGRRPGACRDRRCCRSRCSALRRCRACRARAPHLRSRPPARRRPCPGSCRGGGGRRAAPPRRHGRRWRRRRWPGSPRRSIPSGGRRSHHRRRPPSRGGSGPVRIQSSASAMRLGGAGAGGVDVGVRAARADVFGELAVAHRQHAEQEAPVEFDRARAPSRSRSAPMRRPSSRRVSASVVYRRRSSSSGQLIAGGFHRCSSGRTRRPGGHRRGRRWQRSRRSRRAALRAASSARAGRCLSRCAGRSAPAGCRPRAGHPARPPSPTAW